MMNCNYLFTICSPSAVAKGSEESSHLPVLSNKKSSKLANQQKNKKVDKRKDDLRLTRMMLIIFCCFLLCFLPLMVVNVADDEVIINFSFFSQHFFLNLNIVIYIFVEEY